MLSIISLLLSSTALGVSILAYRQARGTALLGSRREAINHVRSAFSDVALQGRIDAETVSSLREAYQVGSLVFSKKVSDSLDGLYGTAFRLSNKSLERQTGQDWDEKDRLTEALKEAINAMRREAALNKWI